MLGWSKEASLVYKALLMHGLEVPIINNKKSNEIRKRYIATYMMKIIDSLCINVKKDHVFDTPNRIAKMYVEEIFSGLDYINFPKITIFENKIKFDETIIVRNVAVTSTCEHHFVVFDGKATIAYIPKNFVIGLSKISRVVRFFSQRPQIQERLTNQIFIALQVLLDTKNVAISIDAVHFCIKARGIRDIDTITTTTSLGGLFKSSESMKLEFLRKVPS